MCKPRANKQPCSAPALLIPKAQRRDSHPNTPFKLKALSQCNFFLCFITGTKHDKNILNSGSKQKLFMLILDNYFSFSIKSIKTLPQQWNSPVLVSQEQIQWAISPLFSRTCNDQHSTLINHLHIIYYFPLNLFLLATESILNSKALPQDSKCPSPADLLLHPTPHLHLPYLASWYSTKT